MTTAAFENVPVKTLQDPELKAAIQTLRQPDNLTNWYFILRTYLYLTLVIGGTVWFYSYQMSSDISFWWNVPVTMAAIVLVGAGQHQLSGLAHDGVHHTLFRGRELNDLASDLFTMFPLYGSIHHYRLQHLAHHQFVNDPERDPDISQLKSSGHWLSFPVAKEAFLRTLLKQLWIPRLIRFMRVRAAYNATGADRNPYLLKGKKPSKVAVRIGLLYLVSLIGALVGLFYVRDAILLAVVPAAMWVVISLVYWLLPAGKFHQSRVHPVIPLRYMTMMRLGYITALFTGLAEITLLTVHMAALYYLLLWIVPLFTSFSFFMILRQLVQHGNGDRGWLTNTRTFMVGRLINFAVFPMGQNYHLPHHIYASVPHYRLKKLHGLLMERPEYREQATVVEGYFLPPRLPKTNPTVVDVLSPEYAKHSGEVHIDNSVMDADEFEGKDEIERMGESLRQKRF